MTRPHDPLAPAALASGQARPGRRLGWRRWPIVLGVAALLALAAVIAWLLRPGPPAPGIGEPPARSTAGPVRPPATRAAGDTAVAPDAPFGDAGTVDGEGMDDAPPATVDSPHARRAWLERIRELRDAGELEAARASLDEYGRRYPARDLPEDLRGLLSE